MKYARFIRRAVDDSFRDFSGLGNIFILAAVFAVFIKGKSLLTAISGIVFVEVLCSAIKLIFSKKRPEYIPHDNFLEKIQSGSFPSVHSALIVYFGLTVMHFAGSSLVYAVFSAIIIIVGYSRYYLKKHFLIDILSGYFIGLITYLIFYFKFF